MESMQAAPIMQIQNKNKSQETHASILKHEKGGFEDSECQDQHPKKGPNNECENNELENVEKTSDQKTIENGGGVLGPRDRLKRHRREVAGQVWIPDMWGQEHFLKDWTDCSAFDASLMPQGIILARASLMEEGRGSNSNTLSLGVETTTC